jgi:hypothetical protein
MSEDPTNYLTPREALEIVAAHSDDKAMRVLAETTLTHAPYTMTHDAAVALCERIMATRAAPLVTGWQATPKLLLHETLRGTWDGDWSVVIEHPRSRCSYIIGAWDDWEVWLASDVLVDEFDQDELSLWDVTLADGLEEDETDD